MINLKEKFNFKLLTFFAILVIIYLLVLQLKDCSKPIESEKKETITDTVKIRVLEQKTDTLIKERIVRINVPFPSIVRDTVFAVKITPGDSCSDLLINNIYNRSDGGYVKIIAHASCKQGLFIIDEMSGSAFKKDTVFVDTSSHTVKKDSSSTEINSSTTETKILKSKEDFVIATLTPFIQYSPSINVSQQEIVGGLKISTEQLFKHFSPYISGQLGVVLPLPVTNIFDSWKVNIGIEKRFDLIF